MRLLLRVLLMIAVTGLAVLHGADTPPHVVVFLADDLGWEDCKTPNMTRLGREGMTLTHAFVASPSCAPSRAALLTGLSCAHNGAMFNHSRPGAIIKKWPKFFSEIGYETAAIGKTAHYGQVKEYGFDHASHFTYHDDTCIDAACTWLEARKSERPLCLIVGTNWPHVPWPKATRVEKAPPANLIDTAETRAAYAQYLTAVEKADADLGKVYDTARRTLGSNVLFLFTSDHGAQLPFGKWNCYDQGIRTPLMAVWPGQIKAGSTSDAMVSWIDILPTCLEAAGMAAVPNFDGRSFLPVLRGKADQHRGLIFATHSGDGQMNEYPMRAVRSREWKYIRNLAPEREHHTHIDRENPEQYWKSWVATATIDPGAAAVLKKYHHRRAEELFHLTEDPSEQHNLATDPAHAEILNTLRRELDDWMRSQGDEGVATELLVKPRPANKK